MKERADKRHTGFRRKALSLELLKARTAIYSYLTELSSFLLDAREGLFTCLARFFPQFSPSVVYKNQVNYTHWWTA
jgi:hypothetical protein